MIPEPVIFLADWAIRSTVLATGSLIVVGGFRKASPETRHFVLRCGLASSVLLPIGMLAATRVSPKLTPPALSSIRTVLLPTPGGPTVTKTVRAAVSKPTPARLSLPGSDPVDPWIYAEFLYLGGVAASLAWWGCSFARIYKVFLNAYSHSAKADYLVCKDPILTVPVTFGVFRPVILLPAEAVYWPAERLEAVLLHECSHIHRRDWLWLTTASFLSAIQWFNPIMWLLASSLRSTSEESADDYVLQQGVSPSMYANQLLYFASNVRSHLGSSISMARSGHLSLRLKRILDAQRTRNVMPTTRAVALGAVFAASGLALANYAGSPPSLAPKFLPAFEPISSEITAPVMDYGQGHGVARWSDGTEADIKLIKSVSDDEVGWDANGSPVDPNTVAQVGSISTSDTSKRLIAIYYHIKTSSEGEASSIDRIKTRLAGTTPMGGASSNGHGSSSISGSQGGKPSGSSNSATSTTKGGNADAKASGAGGGGAGYGGGAGGGGNSGEIMRAFAVPTDMKSSSLQLGKGVGAFQTISEYPSDSSAWPVKATQRAMPFDVSESSNGIPKNLRQSLVSTVLSFSVSDKVADQDWRIVAYAADGTKLPMMDDGSGPSQSSGGVKLFKAQVMAAPGQIDRVVLEARSLEWIAIPNVALVPGQGSRP